MKHLHLTHPRLGFWVTVELWERDGRYMATASLGEPSRDVGVGDTPQEAVKAALRSLGEPYASEIAQDVELPTGQRGSAALAVRPTCRTSDRPRCS